MLVLNSYRLIQEKSKPQHCCVMWNWVLLHYAVLLFIWKAQNQCSQAAGPATAKSGALDRPQGSEHHSTVQLWSQVSHEVPHLLYVVSVVKIPQNRMFRSL